MTVSGLSSAPGVPGAGDPGRVAPDETGRTVGGGSCRAPACNCCPSSPVALNRFARRSTRSPR
jgi:hypothetical protein